MVHTNFDKLNSKTYFLGALTSEGETVLSNSSPFFITHAWDTCNIMCRNSENILII